VWMGERGVDDDEDEDEDEECRSFVSLLHA